MTPRHSQFTVTLLILVAVGIITLALGLIIWHHQAGVNGQLEAQYRMKNDELVKTQEDVKRLPDRQKELASLERQLSILDQHLTDYEYMPTYLQQMQDRTLATGNIIKVIQPVEPKPLDLKNNPMAPQPATPPAGTTPAGSATPAGGTTTTTTQVVTTSPGTATAQPVAAPAEPRYYYQQINLEVRGQYVNVLKLLDELSHFRKMVYVRTVGITPETRNGVITLSTKLETYAIITPQQNAKAVRTHSIPQTGEGQQSP